MEVETAIASYGWSSHLTVMMVLKLEKVFLQGFVALLKLGQLPSLTETRNFLSWALGH